MKKKLGLLLSVLLTIPLLILPLIGCGEPTETTPADSPFSQLQTKVNTLSTKVAGLEVAIANISIPADLTSRVSSLEGQATSIQDDVGDLEIVIFGAPSQDDIEAVEADVVELGLQIDTTNDEVGVNLVSIEAIQAKYADLVAEYDTLVIELAGLQAQIDGLGSNGNGNGNGDTPTEPEGYQDLLDDVAGLKVSIADVEIVLAEVENDFSELRIELDGVMNDIIDIQTTLEDIDADLIIIDDLWNELGERVDDIEGLVLNMYRVVISRFASGSNYLEYTTLSAGDYAVVLTLYGDDLDTLTISVPSGDKVKIFRQELYGTSNSMCIVIMEPTPFQVDSTWVYPNWTANKTVEVDYTGSGVVRYATIATGVR